MRFALTRAMCALLCLLVSVSLSAQSTNGSISGIARDDTGGVLPGVTVTATNTATGVTRSTVTNETGNFQIALLPPGTYSVAGELSGFQPVKLERVTVNVGSDVSVAMRMRAGVSETISVTAAAPVIETTKSEISSVVNERAVENLPTNGRNFIDFVLTTPGVVRDPRAGDISFAGQRGTLNSMVVDGANNDNTFFGQTVGRTGSGRAPYQFSQDAVKEFQVNSNAYSAEYGRAGGAVVNVVTKSGTNDYNGSAFYFYRDKALNANNYINEINNRPKSPYHFDQYGASLGGPIVRDKHFFFANVDLQRNSTPNIVVLGGGRISSFPTDADSQRGLQILTPLAESYNQEQNQDVFLVKTDHDFGSKTHLSFRYNRQIFHGVNYENSGITNALQHSGNSNVFTDSFSTVVGMTPSNHFFNEVRAQYLKDREPGEANSPAPEAVILQGGLTVLTIGRNSFSPRETTIKRMQVADTATYIVRNHTVKAGFDISKDEILNYFPGNFFGLYRFTSLADFGAGRPSQYTQAFPGPGTSGPITNPDMEEMAVFAQDEWQPMSGLTLNLGFRYDKQDVKQPSVLNPNAQLQAAGYRTNRINTGGGNVAPRLGVAWTPGSDNRTLVRAGYGVFYGRTPSIMVGTAHSNNGINVQTIVFTGNLMPTYPNTFSSLPTGVTLPNPSIFVFDPRFEQPKVEQANFGVDRQLGSDYSVGLSYQYVKGSSLPRSRDVNVGGPTTVTATITGGGTATFTRYTTRPFTSFNRVIAFESSARSRYNGITLDLQKRYANNWQARLAWTHATAKDNKSDATAVVPFSTGDDAKHASDPLNLEKDFTYADTDVRDRIVLSGVWSLDSYSQGLSGFARALAGGWTVSGIISYQTGQPYSPTVGTNDINNDGNPSNDIAPGFTRNSLRLPSQFDVSPRLTRDIQLGGEFNLQLIAEAFNLLNRDNVSNITRQLYTYTAATTTLAPNAAYGVPTATAGQRIIQLAAKLRF